MIRLSMGPLAFDILDPTVKDIARDAVYTDGVYCWDNAIPYYLRQYRVSLPEAFLAHVLARDFVPPVLGLADQRERMYEFRRLEGSLGMQDRLAYWLTGGPYRK